MKRCTPLYFILVVVIGVAFLLGRFGTEIASLACDPCAYDESSNYYSVWFCKTYIYPKGKCTVVSNSLTERWSYSNGRWINEGFRYKPETSGPYGISEKTESDMPELDMLDNTSTSYSLWNKQSPNRAIEIPFKLNASLVRGGTEIELVCYESWLFRSEQSKELWRDSWRRGEPGFSIRSIYVHVCIPKDGLCGHWSGRPRCSSNGTYSASLGMRFDIAAMFDHEIVRLNCIDDYELDVTMQIEWSPSEDDVGWITMKTYPIRTFRQLFRQTCDWQ